MTISYGGIGLTPPPGDQFCGQNFWHGYRIEQVELPGFTPPSGIDHLPLPPEWKHGRPEIGTLHWPTGASGWARCHLVATAAQVAAVAALSATPAAQTLRYFDGARSVETDMWMLPPYPITQGKAGVGQEFYLLTLVDDRYWWWQPDSPSSPTTAPASWSALLTALFAAVGESPTIPAVPADYDVPSPIRWTVGVKPVPMLIDAACASVGLRVVRQLDGTVELHDYATAAAADDANWTEFSDHVMMGGRLSAAQIAGYVPASLNVVFWGYEADVKNKTLVSLALAEYGAAAGVAGRAGIVVADLPAVSGNTAKNNYTTQAATDYYLWALSRTDATLRGFHDRHPTGLDAAQEWVHEPRQLLTRVLRSPLADRNLYGDTPPGVRFPVEITGAYNATTGYPWKRLTLDVATQSYVPAVPAKTGTKLFEVNDDESLTSGDRALAYSNPDGDGFEFQTDGARGGGAACEVRCGSIVSLADDACLFLQIVCATGTFAGMSLTQVTDAAAEFRPTGAGEWTLQEWVDGAPGAWTNFSFNWTGGTGTVVLTFDGDGAPILTVGGNTLLRLCVGTSATFAGGPRNGFTGGGSVSAACDPNDFLLSVGCECCSIDGWEGPDVPGVTKYYCLDTGSGCPGEVLPVTSADRCDTDLVICSGPYDTLEEAEAVCPPITPPACGFTNALMEVLSNTTTIACWTGYSVAGVSCGANCWDFTPPGGCSESVDTDGTLTCTPGSPDAYTFNGFGCVTLDDFVLIGATPTTLTYTFNVATGTPCVGFGSTGSITMRFTLS